MQTPENFRTLGALRRTMVHLRSIMDRQDMPLVNIHKYLWDRFRGVRQDLFVQGIEVSESLPGTEVALVHLPARLPIHEAWIGCVLLVATCRCLPQEALQALQICLDLSSARRERP